MSYARYEWQTAQETSECGQIRILALERVRSKTKASNLWPSLNIKAAIARILELEIQVFRV